MLSLEARSALSGIAVPGHYGRAGATGVVIEEITDLAFASVICQARETLRVDQRGQHVFRHRTAGRAAPGHARPCHVCRCGA